MTVLKHELRQGSLAFWIWTASIGCLLAICIFLFPEMKGEMQDVSEVFASMGSFTAAFGMDRLNFGTLIGFYAVECGNVVGLGGAFYAALCGIQALAKEERDRTAEFLLAHPISRTRVVAEKLLAVMVQIGSMNLLLWALALAAMAAIGEEVPWKECNLLHLAYGLLQVELGCVCFGLSAFIRRGGLGIGLGLAVMAYFLNLIANLSDRTAFLKYFTPFAYAEGADIVERGALDGGLLLLGMSVGVLAAAAGWSWYCRKDLS